MATVEEHKAAIEAAIKAAADDHWYIDFDSFDGVVSLVAGEILWLQGQQGPEVVDINIQEQEIG